MAAAPRDEDELPLSGEELGSIVRAMKKRLPTSGTGSVLRRRLGHSLDYREHRAYVPGDDVRMIDWRASARHGRQDQYLVRTFDAEEQFTLLVALDMCPTMALPAGAPKLRLAGWIAEALARVAAREKLRAGFAGLHDAGGGPVRFHTGLQILPGFRGFAQAIRRRAPHDPAAEPPVAAARLMKALPPASVLVVVSDFYAADLDGYVGLADKGRRGFRQVVMCELDTWPAERAALEGRMVRLEGVGALPGRDGDFEPTVAELDQAGEAIRARHDELRARTRFGGVIHCRWQAPAEPLTPELLRSSFRNWFPHFARESELLARRA